MAPGHADWATKRMQTRSTGLLLAFPVVELGPRTAEHDQVTCHAACANLARIEVLDDVRGDERRKHEDANRRVGSVPDLVRPRLAAQEADDVTLVESALALGGTERGLSAYDEEPLFVRMM